MVAMVVDIDPEAEHTTVDACRNWGMELGSRHRIAIGVVRKHLKGPRFLSSSSPQTHLALLTAVCWGISWTPAVVWKQADHTWR